MNVTHNPSYQLKSPTLWSQLYELAKQIPTQDELEENAHYAALDSILNLLKLQQKREQHRIAYEAELAEYNRIWTE